MMRLAFKSKVDHYAKVLNSLDMLEYGHAMCPNFWRTPIDNDMGHGKGYIKNSLSVPSVSLN